MDCCAVWIAVQCGMALALMGVSSQGTTGWVFHSTSRFFSWQGRQVRGSLAGGLFIHVHVQTAYVLDGVWSVFWCVNVSCASQQGELVLLVWQVCALLPVSFAKWLLRSLLHVLSASLDAKHIVFVFC